MKHVIIGNGVAGTRAAEAIRGLDGQGGITLISDETSPPYSRPLISLVLEGALTPEQILIRDSHFYERLNIEPVLGSRVTSIDPENRLVVLDETDRGKTKQSYAFDRLLIASGADPRGIRAEGLNLGGIYFLRNLDQVSQMEQGLQPRQKALVLGGGLVGFKAAYALLQRGLQVTMLIKSDYPLSMQLDPQAGRLVQDELSARGLDVRLGTEVRAFEGKKRLQTAHLDDGSRIECDLAVIGKGVLPALSFVPGDKISLDLGIRVDDSLQTSVPGIYAAGDVAEHRDIARGTPWVNAIWPEAAAQGRVAGLNMAGRPTPYPGSLGRNMIRVFGLDVMSSGLVNPPANGYEVLERRDPRTGTYRKLVFQGEQLKGAVMVNRIEQSGLLVSLIQSRTPVRFPREALLEPGLNWKKLMPLQ